MVNECFVTTAAGGEAAATQAYFWALPRCLPRWLPAVGLLFLESTARRAGVEEFGLWAWLAAGGVIDPLCCRVARLWWFVKALEAVVLRKDVSGNLEIWIDSPFLFKRVNHSSNVLIHYFFRSKVGRGKLYKLPAHPWESCGRNTGTVCDVMPRVPAS